MNFNLLMVIPRIVSRAGEWYQPPLGIAYILSILKRDGYNIYSLNLNDSDENYADRIQSVIEERSINVVLTGGVTGQYTAIHDVISTVKKVNSSIINVVGGGIITSTPFDAMEALEFADYGVIGEAEIITSQLMEVLKNKGDIEEVPGIIYRNPNFLDHSDLPGQERYSAELLRQKYRRTEKPSPLVDINELPFPDYDGIGYSKLIEAAPNILGMSELRTLPIITSRGCPFKCTFCFQPDGQGYRMRDMDKIFEEIDYLINRFDLRYLIIIDELFGVNQKRVEEFCERIKPYNIKWTATFRIPQLAKNIELLKEANYHTASLGIESMDDGILKSMQKKIKRSETEEALRLLYEAGIGIQGILIFGDPAETKESAQNTLDWWMEHIHYDLQLSAIIAYPGTPIFDHGVAKGVISDPVQFIKDGCPLVKLSDHMSDDDYAWLFQQILSLPRERYSFPKNYKITHLDYQQAKITLEGECVHCQKYNYWKDVRAFMLESMTCVSCGRRHIAPIPEEFTNRVIKNYKKIFETFGRSAFWGINSYFYTFIKKICNDLQDFYLVDRGESRIGVPIEGSKDCVVKSPDIIDKEEIKCVIVAVPNYLSNIKSSVFESHMSVKTVFSIVDLLDENFEISALHHSFDDNVRFVQPDLESSIQGEEGYLVTKEYLC